MTPMLEVIGVWIQISFSKGKLTSLQPMPQDWVKVALKTRQCYNYPTIQCSYHEILLPFSSPDKGENSPAFQPILFWVEFFFGKCPQQMSSSCLVCLLSPHFCYLTLIFSHSPFFSTPNSITRLKPLAEWITTNCGKFLKGWKYQTALPAS